MTEDELQTLFAVIGLYYFERETGQVSATTANKMIETSMKLLKKSQDVTVKRKKK